MCHSTDRCSWPPDKTVFTTLKKRFYAFAIERGAGGALPEHMAPEWETSDFPAKPQQHKLSVMQTSLWTLSFFPGNWLKYLFLHQDNVKHVPSFSTSTAAHSIPFHHSGASVPRAKLRPSPLFRQRSWYRLELRKIFFSEQGIGQHFIVFHPFLLLLFCSVIGRA